MFAQRLSRYCEVNCTSWDVRALGLAELASYQVTREDCRRVLIGAVRLFEKHTTKGPHECHGSMSSFFSVQEGRRHCAMFSILLAFANCANEGKGLALQLSCEIVGLEEGCFTSKGHNWHVTRA